MWPFMGKRQKCPKGHLYDEQNTLMWHGIQLCRACRKGHYLSNRDVILAHRRHSELAGKWRGLHKRDYPTHCEICDAAKGVRSKYFDYHHWEDAFPDRGVWCCKPCHFLVDGFERVAKNPLLVARYLKLKKMIEVEEPVDIPQE